VTVLRELHTIEDIEAVRREAAMMSASCLICHSTGLPVREQIKQATRQSPAILLCFQGYCTRCQLSVPADSAQLRMVSRGEES
jgi:hypothetical protein